MHQVLKRATILTVTILLVTVSAAKDAPVAPDPKAVALIQELGLVESATALRNLPGWKAPKKIVLTSMGPLEALKANAPGVQFVVVNGPDEMLAQVADADAIASGDNVVCDDRVLAAGVDGVTNVRASRACGAQN